MSDNMKSELELQHIFDKVEEALGNGGWALRRIGGPRVGTDDRCWLASTTFDQEDVRFAGASPGMALIGFLMSVLEHEQARGAESEETARFSRDKIDRVKRAIDTLGHEP